MTNNQIIYNIGYRGASGGFLFLHFLLLSEQYCTDMFYGIDFADVLAKQWNITNHNTWKNTEIPPSYIKTLNSDSELDKILFFWNPDQNQFFQKKQQSDFAIRCYNEIADVNWPVLKTFEDFVNLPDKIYQEIYSTLEHKTMLQYLRGLVQSKSVWLYTDWYSQNELAYYKRAYIYYNKPQQEKIQNNKDIAEMWNNISVDKNAVYFLNHSDIQIKLQDLVNSPESLIDHGLIQQVNQKQYDLLKHWKSLHPPELLNKIGIK